MRWKFGLRTLALLMPKKDRWRCQRLANNKKSCGEGKQGKEESMGDRRTEYKERSRDKKERGKQNNILIFLNNILI